MLQVLMQEQVHEKAAGGNVTGAPAVLLLQETLVRVRVNGLGKNAKVILL